MTKGIKQNSESPKPASPGSKRYASGAKLVPFPALIPQHQEKESFPVFLGVAIVLSLLVLITVFILAFTSPKKKAQAAPPKSATPAAAAGTHE